MRSPKTLGATPTSIAFQAPILRLPHWARTGARADQAKTATSLTDMEATHAAGFTLLELVVVLVIAGLLFSLGGPSVGALYDTMQYRDAVREVVSAAKNGRRGAFASGEPLDLLIDTDRNQFALTNQPQSLDSLEFASLPESLDITVVYAAEVSPKPGLAAIRFTLRAARRAVRSPWRDPTAAVFISPSIGCLAM